MSGLRLGLAIVSLVAVGLVAAEPARAAFAARVPATDAPVGLPMAAAPATAPAPTAPPGSPAAVVVPALDPSEGTPVSPAPPPAVLAPRRRAVEAPRLDLHDPWGSGTLAAPTSASKGAALDLVDPWDPSRSFAPSARSERTLDPWAP